MSILHTRVQRMAVLASMSALAFILMLFEFPILPVVGYMKMDFSDLPILLATWLYGPLAGVIVAVAKCFLHALMYGLSLGELIGALANLAAALAIMIPFACFLRKGQGSLRHRLVMGGLSATLVLAVVMGILNYFVLTPAYMQLWGFRPSLPLPTLIVVGIVPFNLIKGALVSFVFDLLALKMQHWVQGHQEN